MNKEIMITQQDLIDWLDRPPSNDDIDLINFIVCRLDNFYKLKKENKRLNNVINGVEEYLNKDFEFYEEYKKYVEFGYMLCKKGLLDKLKELKEGK